jgi:hypothetical protein
MSRLRANSDIASDASSKSSVSQPTKARAPPVPASAESNIESKSSRNRAPPKQPPVAPVGAFASGARGGVALPGGAATSSDKIPRSPKTPWKDPAFQVAKGHVRVQATRQKKHAPVEEARTDTVAASALPEPDQRSESAQVKSTGEMKQVAATQQHAGKDFSAKKFKDDLKAKISAKRPESEDEAKEFAQNPPLDHFEENFSKDLAAEQGKVTGPLEKKSQDATDRRHGRKDGGADSEARLSRSAETSETRISHTQATHRRGDFAEARKRSGRRRHEGESALR